MKANSLLIIASAFFLVARPLQAQETNEIETLKKQIQQINEQFEKTVREQRQLIDSLKERLDSLQRSPTVPTTNRAAIPSVGAAATTTIPMPNRPWSPTDPIRLWGGQQNYINLSLDGLFAAGYSTAEDVEGLQLGGHDPNQRGFTVQNIEATFQGVVDPYFRAQASIVLQIDGAGETGVEAEEAYMETTRLPWNLQARGGHYFSEFGRLNPTHPHSWDFVDQPLVNGRFFGADGLRNPGARLSWLAPTPFYSELFFGVQNSQGETATSFRNDHEDEAFLGRVHEVGRWKSFGDLLFVPRYVTSFELTDEQTLVAGVSGAFGPNASGSSADTQIYGVDLFWKWKPANHHGGFPFVTWQSEAMIRRYAAAAFDWDLNGDGLLDADELDLNGDGVPDTLPRENLTDYGFYSQVAYGFRKGWVAALRGECVTSDRGDYERLYGRDTDRSTRWRLSPNLTWYPSEFSKLRLQYNYDDRGGPGVDHSLWFQFEFLLGAHAAHKF